MGIGNAKDGRLTSMGRATVHRRNLEGSQLICPKTTFSGSPLTHFWQPSHALPDGFTSPLALGFFFCLTLPQADSPHLWRPLGPGAPCLK